MVTFNKAGTVAVLHMCISASRQFQQNRETFKALSLCKIMAKIV